MFLDWINEPDNKSSKIRKTLGFDITDPAQVDEAIKAFIDLTQKSKLFLANIYRKNECV